jgi:hypothetical protein
MKASCFFSESEDEPPRFRVFDSKGFEYRQGDLDGQDSEQAQSKQIFRGHLRSRQRVMIDTMVL